MAVPSLTDDDEPDDDQDETEENMTQDPDTPEDDDTPENPEDDAPEDDDEDEPDTPENAEGDEDDVAVVDGPRKGSIDMDADDGGILSQINTRAVIIAAIGVVVAVIVYRLITSGSAPRSSEQQQAQEAQGDPNRQPEGGRSRDDMSELERDQADMEALGIGRDAPR